MINAGNRIQQTRMNPVVGLVVLGCSLLILCTGCVTASQSTTPFAPAAYNDLEDAVIFLFREIIKDEYKREAFTVSVNGEEIGPLWIYSYYEIHVPPGSHDIAIKYENQVRQLTLDVLANTNTFLMVAGFKLQEHPNPDLAEGKLASRMVLEKRHNSIE